MSESNVIFTLDGVDVSIQCSKEDKIKDICQKFANKVEKNINSFLFLYGGNQLNLLLSFKDLVKDENMKEMRVLTYTKENDDDKFVCPKCGEKIKFNTERIDDIMSSINKLKETIDSAKLLIDSVIKVSLVNNINVQLKGVNLILNTLNEEIKKVKEKVKNLLNDNQEINTDNNYIIAEIIIKDKYVNKDIRILNSYEECLRTNPNKFLKDKIFNNEDEVNKCEIKIDDELIPFNYFHKFNTKGKYKIKYIFKNNLMNATLMFYGCSLLTNIDLSNFNTNNVTNMNGMFQGCSSLLNIDLSNFNTSNVTNMNSMFYGCSSLTKIDLSNFNTSNVTNMIGMFRKCSSLKKKNIITKDKKYLDNMNLF